MPNKTYGVMMKAEMIRAYLAGLKTQTRRMKGLQRINQYPDRWTLLSIGDGLALFRDKEDQRHLTFIRLPYGDESSTLWFKETWAIICNNALPTCECETDEDRKANHYVEYRADNGNPYPGEWPEEEARGNEDAPKWRSSMLMPKKYSRFQNIPILKVRVERLRSITPADAFAEGVRSEYLHQVPDWMDVDSYAELWNKINGKTFPWQSNPWVFVYEFPKYNKEQS